MGDIARFPRPANLASYLGLDPRVRQTGDKPAHTGHISRAGQAHARGLLIEAAHAAVRVPGPLRAFHLRLLRRHSAGVAIMAVARTLRLHDATEAEVAAAERAIAVAVVDDARVRHLLSVPGIGLAVAASLVAAIGDVTRFGRPAKLASYLGLDPRVRRSGQRSFTGHISRAGQAHARGLLIEAAHAAVRTPGPLHARYELIRRRRGAGCGVAVVGRA